MTSRSCMDCDYLYYVPSGKRGVIANTVACEQVDEIKRKLGDDQFREVFLKENTNCPCFQNSRDDS